jgi:hypothetical protein
MRALAAVLSALWAGSLCTICGVVAPTLFAILPDGKLAGRLAAHFFELAAVIGGVIGFMLLIMIFTGRLVLPKRLGVGLVLAAAALPVLSEVALGPLMNAARAAQDMARFGLLHGLAALLFFGACISAVALVALVSRRAE